MEVAGPLGTPLGLAQRKRASPRGESFPGEKARSWGALGEARPGQSSLSAGALRYRAWAQSWSSAALCFLFSWVSALYQAKDEVDQYEYVQDDVIEIRDQPFVAGGENPDAVPETLVIPLQFLFARAEDRKIPVAHKLYGEPEQQDAKENPLSGRREAVERDDAEGELLPILRSRCQDGAL